MLTGATAASVHSRLAESDALLRAKVAAAAQHGIKAEGLLLFGDAIRAILSTIDAREIDLVVMGTHGSDAHAGIMLGSVVEEVVRRAKVPVLTASVHLRPGRWRGCATRPLGFHARRTSELPPRPPRHGQLPPRQRLTLLADGARAPGPGVRPAQSAPDSALTSALDARAHSAILSRFVP